MTALRTAYVTGASSGLGAELARALAGRGATVVLAARRADRLAELAAELGPGAHAAPVDVGDAAAVRAEVARWDGELGGLDLVVANAGVGEAGPAPELPWESVERVLRVNAIGAIATLHAGLERMLPRGRGTLVGMSSLAAYRGLATSGSYAASKACLSTYLETLRADLRGTGVRVVDVRPGFVHTEMTRGATHPLPFVIGARPAAERILRGVERGKAQIAFPWQLWWPLAAAQALPNFAWRWLDRVVVRVVRE